MFCVFSLISIVAGATLACAAERVPSRVAVLETGGGALLVGGLVLLGSALGAVLPPI
jgi:hypothetical protein